jgi:hypothetical protein
MLRGDILAGLTVPASNDHNLHLQAFPTFVEQAGELG